MSFSSVWHAIRIAFPGRGTFSPAAQSQRDRQTGTTQLVCMSAVDERARDDHTTDAERRDHLGIHTRGSLFIRDTALQHVHYGGKYGFKCTAGHDAAARHVG